MPSNDISPPPVSRRSLLQRAGLVAGTAAVPGAVLVATSDADAAAVAPAKAVKDPTDAQPAAPIMAYIHDRKKGTVVIMNGDHQRTVQDKELVRRLTVIPKKPKRKVVRRKRKATRRDAALGV